MRDSHTDLLCTPCLAVRAEQEAAIEREREALAARQQDEQRFAADSEAAQVRFWVRCGQGVVCGGAVHDASDVPVPLTICVNCVNPRPRRSRGGAARSWPTSGVLDCVCPVVVAASTPPWFASQAEIAEVQSELADKRRELEALESELKEVKERVAAAKDAGGCLDCAVSCCAVLCCVVLLGFPSVCLFCVVAVSPVWCCGGFPLVWLFGLPVWFACRSAC